jgi:hypothetical protein
MATADHSGGLVQQQGDGWREGLLGPAILFDLIQPRSGLIPEAGDLAIASHPPLAQQLLSVATGAEACCRQHFLQALGFVWRCPWPRARRRDRQMTLSCWQGARAAIQHRAWTVSEKGGGFPNRITKKR